MPRDDQARQCPLLRRRAARRGDSHYCRLGLHLPRIDDPGGSWDQISFHATRDIGVLLACLDGLRRRVPRYKPLSIGVGLLPPDARAFRGRAAFDPVPESREF